MSIDSPLIAKPGHVQDVNDKSEYSTPFDTRQLFGTGSKEAIDKMKVGDTSGLHPLEIVDQPAGVHSATNAPSKFSDNKSRPVMPGTNDRPETKTGTSNDDQCVLPKELLIGTHMGCDGKPIRDLFPKWNSEGEHTTGQPSTAPELDDRVNAKPENIDQAGPNQPVHADSLANDPVGDHMIDGKLIPDGPIASGAWMAK